MFGRDFPAAMRAWRSYAGSGAYTRAFLLGRLAILPLGRLDAPLRGLSGVVLSLGSGHGILERYLTEINPSVSVEGFELAGDRVEAAAATGDRAPRVTIHHADVTQLDDARTYDAAIAVDVLHHVPADDHPRVAKAVAERLRPGGTLLVKDMDVEPRWKWAWNRMHDRLVSGSEPTYCRPPEQIAAVFEAAGLRTVDIQRFHHHDPYPQYLVVLEKPAVTTA
jgi:SAM-dependent methyltransferase